MEFEVIETVGFVKDFSKLERNDKYHVRKKLMSLSFNPSQGKPLRTNLREFRYKHLRIYFSVIFADFKVYVVGISSKKDQDVVINKILSKSDSFRKFENKIYKGDE